MYRKFGDKLGVESIPAEKKEYVLTLPLEKVLRRFGLKQFEERELVESLIRLIVKIGRRWLRKHIDYLDLSIIGGRIFVLIQADARAVWDLLEQLPEIERIDANFDVFALPDVPQDDLPLPGKKKRRSLRALTHETTAYLGFDKIHEDPRFEKGSGITLGVIDTGLGLRDGRPAPQLLVDPENPSSEYRVKWFKDFTKPGYPEGKPYDDQGHGTCVASIAAGGRKHHSGKNKTYIGGLPLATLYGAKVLDSSGRGTLFGVIKGVEWMTEQHPDVINMSLGSNQNTDGTDALSKAVDEAWSQGIVVCIAMGNSGNNARGYCNGTVGTPACSFNPVKATATSGVKSQPEAIQSWASRPPTLDGRKGPELHVLAAPGLHIEMYDNRGSGRSGTSFACPYVSAFAGVVVKALQVAEITYTPDKVREFMEKYTFTLGYKDKYGEEAGWCIEGHGRIDPLKAWEEIVGSKPVPEPKPEPKPEPTPVIPVVAMRIAVNGQVIYEVESTGKMQVDLDAEPRKK